MNKKTNCSKCQKEVDAGARFCPECGAKLKANASQEKKSTPAHKKKIIREAMMVAGAVLLLTAAFFVFNRPQELPQPQAMNEQTPPGHGDMANVGEALANMPEDYGGLVAAGDKYMDQGNFPVAAECYRRALEIDGSSADVRSDFGSCLYGMGLADRAIEEFKNVLAAHPGHSIAMFNMGIVFYNQSKSDSARYYFSRYLSVDPNGKAAASARGLLQELGT